MFVRLVTVAALAAALAAPAAASIHDPNPFHCPSDRPCQGPPPVHRPQ